MSIHVVLDYVYSIEISRNTFTGANTNHVHYQRAHLNLDSNDDVVKIVKSILKTDGATNWEKNVVFGSIVNQYKAVPKDKEILDFNGRWDPIDMSARIVMGYSVKDIENGSLTIDDNSSRSLSLVAMRPPTMVLTGFERALRTVLSVVTTEV